MLPRLACGEGRHQSAGVLKPDIRSLQAGDSPMWEVAFHWLWPVACVAAHRRLGNLYAHDVEDVAISAIGEAAEAVQAGKVASFEQLKALAGVIANRRALDHIRHMQAERRATGSTETLEGRENLASSAPTPLEELDACDLARLLVELARKLPGNQRRLLLACYFEGLKQTELAERFEIPIGTVGVTLSRALESLREELRNHPQWMKEFRERLRFL